MRRLIEIALTIAGILGAVGLAVVIIQQQTPPAAATTSEITEDTGIIHDPYDRLTGTVEAMNAHNDAMAAQRDRVRLVSWGLGVASPLLAITARRVLLAVLDGRAEIPPGLARRGRY